MSSGSGGATGRGAASWWRSIGAWTWAVRRASAPPRRSGSAARGSRRRSSRPSPRAPAGRPPWRSSRGRSLRGRSWRGRSPEGRSSRRRSLPPPVGRSPRGRSSRGRSPVGRSPRGRSAGGRSGRRHEAGRHAGDRHEADHRADDRHAGGPTWAGRCEVRRGGGRHPGRRGVRGSRGGLHLGRRRHRRGRGVRGPGRPRSGDRRSRPGHDGVRRGHRVRSRRSVRCRDPGDRVPGPRSARCRVLPNDGRHHREGGRRDRRRGRRRVRRGRPEQAGRRCGAGRCRRPSGLRGRGRWAHGGGHPAGRPATSRWRGPGGGRRRLRGSRPRPTHPTTWRASSGHEKGQGSGRSPARHQSRCSGFPPHEEERCGGGRVFRRCPTLPRPVGRSTIGAGGLSFRVRDGSGRFPSAVTTGTPHHPHKSGCPVVGWGVWSLGYAQWTRTGFSVSLRSCLPCSHTSLS